MAKDKRLLSGACWNCGHNKFSKEMCSFRVDDKTNKVDEIILICTKCKEINIIKVDAEEEIHSTVNRNLRKRDD